MKKVFKAILVTISILGVLFGVAKGWAHFYIARSKSGLISSLLNPFSLSYSISPPYVQTQQSAPEVFSKIVFSASIASFKTSSIDFFSK